MDEGHPFVTFTDECTSDVFKVRSDLYFLHIYSANKKNIDGEGYGKNKKNIDGEGY